MPLRPGYKQSAESDRCMSEQPAAQSVLQAVDSPMEPSIESLGLVEGEALQTSPREMVFGWGLVLLAFVLVIGAAAIVVTVLLVVGLVAMIPYAFSMGEFG